MTKILAERGVQRAAWPLVAVLAFAAGLALGGADGRVDATVRIVPVLCSDTPDVCVINYKRGVGWTLVPGGTVPFGN